MNIYRISQHERLGYDTYDSAVVIATSDAAARNINPEGYWGGGRGAWASSSENVLVELIGKAIKGSHESILLSSFNAG